MKIDIKYNEIFSEIWQVFDSDLNQYISIESGEKLIKNYSGIRVLPKLQINYNFNNNIINNKTIDIQNNDLNSIQFNSYVNQFIVNQTLNTKRMKSEDNYSFDSKLWKFIWVYYLINEIKIIKNNSWK